MAPLSTPVAVWYAASCGGFVVVLFCICCCVWRLRRIRRRYRRANLGGPGAHALYGAVDDPPPYHALPGQPGGPLTLPGLSDAALAATLLSTAAPSGPWNCPVCTFINTQDRGVCSMCGTPNELGNAILTLLNQGIAPAGLGYGGGQDDTVLTRDQRRRSKRVQQTNDELAAKREQGARWKRIMGRDRQLHWVYMNATEAAQSDSGRFVDPASVKGFPTTPVHSPTKRRQPQTPTRAVVVQVGSPHTASGGAGAGAGAGGGTGGGAGAGAGAGAGSAAQPLLGPGTPTTPTRRPTRNVSTAAARVLSSHAGSGQYVCCHTPAGDLEWVPVEYAEAQQQANATTRKSLPASQLQQQQRAAPPAIVSPEGWCTAAALPFDDKCAWFKDQLHHLRVPYSMGKVQCNVRRDAILYDSLNQFRGISLQDMHKTFRFTFVDETGVDAGGLAREWFSLIIEALFDKEQGLFCTADVDQVAYWINPRSSAANDMHLEFFHFCGRVVGKALFDGHCLPAYFCLPMFKHILGAPVSLHDMQHVDNNLYKSLLWMRNNHVSESLCMTFGVQETTDGPVWDLIPGGRDVAVTDANKELYIYQRLKYTMLTSIKGQLGQFLAGIYEVIPENLLSVFDFQELELLVCGVPNVDIEDWMTNTTYRDCRPTDKLVKWFWEAVRSFTAEECGRLLQFATGSSRVPPQGFVGLQSNDGKYQKFCVHVVPSAGDADFPRAHTCFNRLELPKYSTAALLRSRLSVVLRMNSLPFGLE